MRPSCMSREQLCLLCREKPLLWEIPSAREERLQAYERSIALSGDPKGCRGRAESPPAFLPEYLYPVGFFANYGPKVSKGERREARAQWAQPPKAVSDPEFRQTTSGTHGSAGRADCLPRGKPFGAPAGAHPCPRWGLMHRLRRGERACSPMGRSIASGGDPKGVQGGERKAPLLAALGNNFAVSKSPGGE